MKTFLLLLAICFVTSLGAAEPRFTNEGLEIDAGSLGKFTLEYPSLFNAEQKSAHKLREKVPSGKTGMPSWFWSSVSSLG